MNLRPVARAALIGFLVAVALLWSGALGRPQAAGVGIAVAVLLLVI